MHTRNCIPEEGGQLLIPWFSDHCLLLPCKPQALSWVIISNFQAERWLNLLSKSRENKIPSAAINFTMFPTRLQRKKFAFTSSLHRSLFSVGSVTKWAWRVCVCVCAHTHACDSYTKDTLYILLSTSFWGEFVGPHPSQGGRVQIAWTLDFGPPKYNHCPSTH